MPVRLLLAALFLLPAAGADVVVSTLDGKQPLRGISLAADSTTISLHSADGPVVKVPTADVVEISTVPQPPPPPPSARPFEVVLTDGSRLRGVLDAGPQDALRLRSALLQERQLDIPLEQVISVHRADGRKIPGASRLAPVKDEDAAYTLTGAQTIGVLARFTSTGAVIDRDKGSARRIAYANLAAIFLDNRELPRPEGLHVVARLADGSAVVLRRTFVVAHGTLTGETPSGLALRIPVARLAALGFMGGSFVHLSDLKATVGRVPFFPLAEGPAREAMLDFVCPVRLDRSPDGHPITVGKRRYFKGIGVRPRTELTYALGGKYRFFQAVCGIDDEIFGPGYGRGAGAGSVVFSLIADGRKVYESPVVVGGRKPETVRVPVAGVRRLTLVVDLVPKEKMPKGRPDSPELDNAVWARPLLIR